MASQASLPTLPSHGPLCTLTSSSSVTYELCISTSVDNTLVVHLTSADGPVLPRTWTGTYSQQYVEDITRKSGNYKKFATFHTMLLEVRRRRRL